MTSDELEERAKQAAGYRAVDAFVRPGTCIGLGTGTTALYAIERAGQLVAAGTELRAVATSLETERLCREYGIPLVPFCSEPIDVAIDGADEVAPDWALIKGGGGALFREKAVALAAQTFVVIVTARKLVERLGAFGLPLEVVPFSAPYVARQIALLGGTFTLRQRAGAPFTSDNGNLIFDCDFGLIEAPAELDAGLRAVHGVVATGIFVGLTSHLLISKADGSVEERSRR